MAPLLSWLPPPPPLPSAAACRQALLLSQEGHPRAATYAALPPDSGAEASTSQAPPECYLIVHNVAKKHNIGEHGPHARPPPLLPASLPDRQHRSLPMWRHNMLHCTRLVRALLPQARWRAAPPRSA